MSTGYIKLPRSFFHFGEVRATPSRPWCNGMALAWMLSEAQFQDQQVTVNGRILLLKRGQFTHSVRFMAEKFCWDKSKLNRYLTRLKVHKVIETHSETGQLVITICNYEEYQGGQTVSETAGETVNETRPRHDRDTTETKYKKERKKEGKNQDLDLKSDQPEKGAARSRRASLFPEDWTPSDRCMSKLIEAGHAERELHFQARRCRDHHIAKGNTFKDHDAAFRNWMMNQERWAAERGPSGSVGVSDGGVSPMMAKFLRDQKRQQDLIAREEELERQIQAERAQRCTPTKH